MLKEAKKWVQELEEMLNRMAAKHGKTVEEMDKAFEDFYYDGGSEYDLGGGPSSIEAFVSSYELALEDEDDDEDDDEDE